MPVDDAGDDSEGGIGAKMRKIFANRKNLSAADRKRLEKERKARQLRRLRKLLTPKNAVVALHELQGPGMSEFTINTNGQETTAEIVVNNVRYEATAPNKHMAKARASEKALRDLVIAQMAKARQSAETTAAAATTNNGNNGSAAGNEDVEMSEMTETDDVPMLHLASYALYKLFNEWQNEGFEIPAIKPIKAAVKLNEAGVHPLAPKVPKTKADLPSDAATRHPTALLALMRPQIPYEDLGSNNTNDPTKREFSVGVTVDGQRFIDNFALDSFDPPVRQPALLGKRSFVAATPTSQSDDDDNASQSAAKRVRCSEELSPNLQNGPETIPDGHHAIVPRKRELLPPNAAELHPRQLLKQMIPSITCTLVSYTVDNGTPTFRYNIAAEGKIFTGAGPNKRTARFAAAARACEGLFEMRYDDGPEVNGQLSTA
nr:uncharacterized protein LOC109405102 [Aedes albopictus]